MSKIASKIVKYHTWINQSGNMGILIGGGKHYYDCLIDAFPMLRFSSLWEPRYEEQVDLYDWGIFINQADEEMQNNVKNLLDLFMKVIFVQTSLSQTFALDYHMTRNGQSQIGNLVYRSKPYKSGKKPDLEATIRLSRIFAKFIQQHPSYARADLLIPVPSSSSEQFNLPSHISQNLESLIGKSNNEDIVAKIKKTKPMKDIETEEEKHNTIQGAFKVISPENVVGKRVILLDDICHSGATLHEVATVLKQAGATVLGLVATKTLRDAQ